MYRCSRSPTSGTTALLTTPSSLDSGWVACGDQHRQGTARALCRCEELRVQPLCGTRCLHRICPLRALGSQNCARNAHQPLLPLLHGMGGPGAGVRAQCALARRVGPDAELQWMREQQVRV